MTGEMNMNKHKLTALSEPTADDDAVTRKYVDNSVQATGTVLQEVKLQCLRRDESSTLTGDRYG